MPWCPPTSPSTIPAGGSVQQGLSAAYELRAFIEHRSAADKRYSFRQEAMKSSVPRAWLHLHYADPKRILSDLRRIAETHPLEEYDYKVQSLRTRELRKAHESRQAALFALGLGIALDTPVQYAHSENRDYDAIVRYQLVSGVNYLPVQLKEWVPDFLNPSATLQNELDKLTKYVDSSDLAVAFYLNRDATINIQDLRLPYDSVGGLWFFGCIDPTKEKWFILGNMLIPGARRHEFLYPAA